MFGATVSEWAVLVVAVGGCIGSILFAVTLKRIVRRLEALETRLDHAVQGGNGAGWPAFADSPREAARGEVMPADVEQALHELGL